MESRPQNPEFRNIPENLHPVDFVLSWLKYSCSNVAHCPRSVLGSFG